MSNVTFYFIRHGYSCSNLNKKKSVKMRLLSGDSHLTNWGIISSIFTGLYLHDTFLNDVTFNYTFCSPLIRTWETAACMFSDKYNTFTVAPYLSENRMDEKKPYSYKTNKKRFKEFVNYVSSNEQNSMQYLIKNLDNGNVLEQQIKEIKKCKINFDRPEYSDEYTNITKSSIEKFINWFIKNSNTTEKINVLVICHNTLMIRFLDKYYHYNYYKHNIMDTNNFSFEVTVKNNKIGHPIIFFLGIHNPVGDEDEIDINCSLCVKDRKCNNIDADKKIHMKLINNKEKYLFT